MKNFLKTQNERTNERKNLYDPMSIGEMASYYDVKDYINDQAQSWLRNHKKKLCIDAFEKAEKELITTAIKRQYVSDFCDEGKTPHEYPSKELNEILLKQSDKLIQKSPFMLLTINPRMGWLLGELKPLVEKFVKKKWIREYFYVYEVRRTPTKEIDPGLHVHILLRYTGRPYDCKKSIKKMFASVCDTNNPEILNIKYIPETLLPEKIDYLLGRKKDSKHQGVLATVEYRKQNKLKPYYESSPPLTCRATNDLKDTLSIEYETLPQTLPTGSVEDE